MKRANLLVGAGAALLIIGLAVMWLLARDDDGGSSSPKVAVLVAKADLKAGEAGSDLVDSGRAGVALWSRDDVPAGALSNPTDLTGRLLAADVAEGGALTAASVRTTSLGQGSIKIPEGKQAVALTVDFTAAVAGYTGPGDHVNIYVNIPPNTPGAPRQPYTKLLLSDVEVLDISQEVGPRRAETPGEAQTAAPPKLTLLVAVDPQQAEAAIFAASQNELWMSLLPDGQGESTTAGVDYGTNYLEGLDGGATAEAPR